MLCRGCLAGKKPRDTICFWLPVIKNACPADGYTKREEAKEQLRAWNQKDHNITNRIFSAIQSSELKGWSK